VFWDVSEFSQEMMQVVVEDRSTKNGIQFSNLRVFNEPNAGASCLPDCLTIKPIVEGHMQFTESLVAFEIMGAIYAARDASAEVTPDERLQYCRVGKEAFGLNGGAPINFGGELGAGSKIRSGVDLPACIFITPVGTADGSLSYVISIDEATPQKFLYTTGHADADSAEKNTGLMCIYSTKKPRCAAYRGLLRQVTQYSLACEVRQAPSDCFKTFYSELCVGEVCGSTPTHQSALQCCDKADGKPNSCLGGSRRRLGAAVTQVKYNTYTVDGQDAVDCADKCMRSASCVAYNSSPTGCVLSDKCSPVASADSSSEVLDWTVLPGVELHDLFEGAELVGGKVVIKTHEFKQSN